MALEITDLKLLARLKKNHKLGPNVCILGDCFFYFDNRTLFKIVGKDDVNYINDKNKASLETFKLAFDFKRVETIDIHGKPTIKLDLQKPIPTSLKRKFDLVIDAGTLYWCFDIASVWKNILDMLKPKGNILHISALTGYFGRGYYNFHPRLFVDFYKQNGFEVITLASKIRPPSIFIPKNIYSFLFYRLMLILKGKNNKLDWHLFNKNKLFLKKSDNLEIIFNVGQSKQESDILPNNAQIACFVKRKKIKKFTTVLPSFY